MGLVGNRPYGNMAQPNHLATFLCISLLSFMVFIREIQN
ncbi:hypothetical protein DKE48_001775 [Acinetobacter nosocomialis]|nr:hypothetical protein DKE48_001775 [Acinetobacter nosocomialis]